MSEIICPYCGNNFIKMLDTNEWVCETCGYVKDSTEYKPGVLSEKYD